MQKRWIAQWIMDARFDGLVPLDVFHKQLPPPPRQEHRADLKNLHTLFRKTFSLTEHAKTAVLDITADDYYKLWVNENFVGQGPAPSYDDHYFYNRFDISKFLVQGENVIAVHVYYQGLINRVWNSGDYRQGMLAELLVNDEFLLGTDSSWKYSTAHEFTGTDIIGYETQYLEHIDNRLKQTGWRMSGFDDSNWQPACEHQSDDHVLVLQPTPPVAVYEVRPQCVEQTGDGRYLIDFGQEITGQFSMQAHGEAGQVVEIRCGEELEDSDDARVRFKMRCDCTYQEYWTLSGNIGDSVGKTHPPAPSLAKRRGEERDVTNVSSSSPSLRKRGGRGVSSENGPDTLEHYDYKAFRYVEVLAPDQTVDPDSFSAVARHYPFDEAACTFRSSNSMLNGIWEICKNGVKYGTQELYLDCPSREKGQYLGDAFITAQAHAYLTGDLWLWKKSIQDFARSTRVCPGLMGVAPGSLMQEVADFSLLWPLYLLTYYRHSGDLEFLQEMYPVANNLVTYFSRYQRANGLLENVNDKWNLVDWPDNLRDGYDFNLSQEGVGDGCHNVVNAYYCGAVNTLNAIRDVLHIPYENTFPMLKQAFINAFYNSDTRLFVDSTTSTHSALHANTIALFYGLLPDDAIASVVDLIRQKRLNCGVYHAYFLLKGLARVGEYALIYDLLTSDDEHSWANMLREGATTCFEAWGKEQKWNTSLCHPWASSPIIVFIEDILGLKPGSPGWKTIAFTPQIPTVLNDLFLEISTVQGRIRVYREHGQVTMEQIGV